MPTANFEHSFLLTFVVYFFVSFANQLLELPLVGLFESVICNVHYRRNPLHARDVEERLCKITPVQDELSNIVGWKLCFDAVPGLLTAIFYGTVAERYGRRIVVSLCITGNLLMLAWLIAICSFEYYLPIRLIWLSSIFLFIGGGQRIFCSMIYTLISDSCGHSTRSKYLYLLASGPHICRFLAPPFAAILMNTSLYTPFWISMTTLCVCLFLLPFMNESRDYGKCSQYEPVSGLERSSLTEDQISPDIGPLLLPAESYSPLPKSIRNTNSIGWRDLITTSFEKITLLFDNSASRFCLATFFFKRVAFTSENFMFQYASEKFGWTLQRTSWLRVANASGAIFATMIALPSLTSLFVRKGTVAHRVDIISMRSSMSIVSMSFFIAWRARTGLPFLFAMLGCGLGEGIEPALQGFLTFLTNSSENARLFTTVAMADTLAELTGGPVTARLMAIGRSQDKPSEGFCFLTSSVMFSVLIAWALLVKAER